MKFFLLFILILFKIGVVIGQSYALGGIDNDFLKNNTENQPNTILFIEKKYEQTPILQQYVINKFLLNEDENKTIIQNVDTFWANPVEYPVEFMGIFEYLRGIYISGDIYEDRRGEITYFKPYSKNIRMSNIGFYRWFTLAGLMELKSENQSYIGFFDTLHYYGDNHGKISSNKTIDPSEFYNIKTSFDHLSNLYYAIFKESKTNDIYLLLFDIDSFSIPIIKNITNKNLDYDSIGIKGYNGKLYIAGKKLNETQFVLFHINVYNLKLDHVIDIESKITNFILCDNPRYFPLFSNEDETLTIIDLLGFDMEQRNVKKYHTPWLKNIQDKHIFASYFYQEPEIKIQSKSLGFYLAAILSPILVSIAIILLIIVVKKRKNMKQNGNENENEKEKEKEEKNIEKEIDPNEPVGGDVNSV